MVSMVDNEVLLKNNEQEKDGQDSKVADIPKKIIEPDLRVLVARDRMEASLEVSFPPDSCSLEIDELIERINKTGVVFGIDRDSVKRAYKSAGFSVVCARGQKPVDGHPGTIKYHVNIENTGRPQEMADGSVDFKHLNFFTMVQEGDVLAEKVPATTPIPGTDVLGNEVPGKPGKEVVAPIGKNVQLVDGKNLVAGISGQLLLQTIK